jgi:hypothetical protein
MSCQSKIIDVHPISAGPICTGYSDQAVVSEQLEISARTSALVRGIRKVLEHHRTYEAIISGLEQQIHTYLDSSPSEKIWLKRAKYLLCRPQAEYLNNALPDEPDIPFKFTGICHKWYKQRIRCFNRRNTHLWYSWLQTKRAALPVSDAFVNQTYEDHFKTLTSEDVGDESTIEEIFQDKTFRRVLKSLKKEITLREESDFSVSKSSCFEYTRSQGGQDSFITESFNNRLFDSVLTGIKFYPNVYRSGRLMKNVLVEIRTLDGGEEWKEFVSDLLKRYVPEPPSCTIQAVLEPMKVRVISKGNAIPYYLSRNLQRSMHDAMRKRDCFRLIGRPFCPTDLFDLMEKSDQNDEWFSVDYSAATDALSWKYSGRIFEYLISHLPLERREMFRAVLGPHKLHYPQGKEVVYRGEQTNGQLMGSVLSFPILCLANLGVYLLTTQDHQREWSHKERLRHVLINGDDMLYRAPVELWERHIDLGKKVGLNMSVGKSYHHKEYSNVNSTSVHMKYGSTPWQIDYLNVGLYFGQHKVQERIDNRELAREHTRPDNVSAVIDVLMKGSLPGRQVGLLAEFLRDRKDDVERESLAYLDGRYFTRNLFTPLNRGGMGVQAPCGFKYYTTEKQKMIDLRGDCPHSQMPLPGYSLVKHLDFSGAPYVKLTDLDIHEVPRYKSSTKKKIRWELPYVPNPCIVSY